MRRKGRAEGSQIAMNAFPQDEAHSSSSYSPMARTDYLLIYPPWLPEKGQATVILLYSGENIQM